jgi:hypothetical protein
LPSAANRIAWTIVFANAVAIYRITFLCRALRRMTEFVGLSGIATSIIAIVTLVCLDEFREEFDMLWLTLKPDVCVPLKLSTPPRVRASKRTQRRKKRKIRSAQGTKARFERFASA